MKRRECVALPFLLGLPAVQAAAPNMVAEDKEEATYAKEREKNTVSGIISTVARQSRKRDGDEFRVLEDGNLIQTMLQPADGSRFVVRPTGTDFEIVWSFPDKVFELPDGGSSHGTIVRVDKFGKRIDNEEERVEVEVEKEGIMSRYTYTIEYLRSVEVTSVVYHGVSRLPYTIQQEAATKGSGDLIETTVIRRLA